MIFFNNISFSQTRIKNLNRNQYISSTVDGVATFYLTHDKSYDGKILYTKNNFYFEFETNVDLSYNLLYFYDLSKDLRILRVTVKYTQNVYPLTNHYIIDSTPKKINDGVIIKLTIKQ